MLVKAEVFVFEQVGLSFAQGYDHDGGHDEVVAEEVVEVVAEVDLHSLPEPHDLGVQQVADEIKRYYGVP